MKHCLFFICLTVLQYYALAQQKNQLHYFTQKKDSLVGVKDNKGKIIIPAHYPNHSYENGEKIRDDASMIILLDFSKDNKTPAHSYGDAFDRKGNFLFHPLMYDNGPDYIAEGTFRCVQNGKAGFADRLGNVIIEPQWDWVGPFNYGYAFVCNGCYWDRNKDSEHPPLAFHPNAERYYINKNGLKTDSLKAAIDTILDYKPYQGGYYPNPFKYDAREQKIVDSFNSKHVLLQIGANKTSDYDATDIANIRFEITDRPNAAFPYYVVQGYENQNLTQDLIFLVDKKGNWFYYGWEDKRIDFSKWIKQYSNR